MTKRIFVAIAAFAAVVALGATGCTKDPGPDYAITVSDDGKGSATASVGGSVVEKAKAGTKVTVEAVADQFYQFSQWVVVEGNVELDDATAASATFTMPAGKVELQAEFRDGEKFSIGLSCEGSDDGEAIGTASAYVDDAKVIGTQAGRTVVLEATPKPFYRFKQWVVVEGDIELDDVTAARVTFTMPAAMVEIKAEFEKPLNAFTLAELFPDKAFRAFVSEKYDLDADGELSAPERAAITKEKELLLGRLGISDLTGIEFFAALKELLCYGNNLTDLDISKNTQLVYLNCDDNNLSDLDLTNNRALSLLCCSGNALTDLDVSKNTELKELSCRNNSLTGLDVTKNIALKELYCENNSLTDLDVSENTALTHLYCASNNLSALDISKNTLLSYLTCGPGVPALDVTVCADAVLYKADGSDYTITIFACDGSDLYAAIIEFGPEGAKYGVTVYEASNY